MHNINIKISETPPVIAPKNPTIRLYIDQLTIFLDRKLLITPVKSITIMNNGNNIWTFIVGRFAILSSLHRHLA